MPDNTVALQNLPLTVDPLDQGLTLRSNNFATTVDSMYIFACGYPDYSFRVIDSESGEYNSKMGK